MKIIDDITNFIFIKNKPAIADIIMIPGCNYPEIGETSAKLWKENFAPFILASGKVSIKIGKFEGSASKDDIYKGPYNTESDFMEDVIIKCGVPKSYVLKECESTYTKENAFFSRKVTIQRGLNIKKALICCKSFHARRVLMSYQFAFPETDFLIIPVDIDNIKENNWYKTEKGIELVLGELTRCGNQFNYEFKSANINLRDIFL